jgi:hypothetical protein
MLMKQFYILSILLGAATGCGDDGGAGNDGCTGHLCGSDVAITDPEGGNVIFEYIYVDSELQAAFGLPSGVNTITRVIAYFLDGQTPESNPLPMPGQCNNLATTRGWPLHVGTPRTELDVGTLSITGKNTAGADVTIPLMKMPAGSDAIGRPHTTFYQNITPDAAANLKFNSSYSVVMGGAGSVPATTLTDSLFLPENYTLGAPLEENNGPMVPGTDFVASWNPAVSSNLPAGDEVLGLTWLLDSNGSPTHLCPTAHSAGTFTIPGATIAEYKAVAMARGTNPNKVILSRQAVTHKLSRLPNGDNANKRRIDMLAIACWVQLMDVQ